MATVATTQRKTGKETTSRMHWFGATRRRVTYRHHHVEGESYWTAQIDIGRPYQDQTGKGNSKKLALRDLKSKVTN